MSAPGRAIAVLAPVVRTDAVDVEATLRALREPGLRLEGFFIARGPASVETEEDVAACLPGVLDEGVRIAEAGWEAIVVDCMCDPGVPELRARIAIPVLGPAESAMRALAAGGARFSVLDVVSGGRGMVERQVAAHGAGSRYVSHRSIDIPVLDLLRDPVATADALEAEALGALADGADTLLLGCTGLAEVASDLQRRLRARGRDAAVVEPLSLTVRAARALLDARGPRGEP